MELSSMVRISLGSALLALVVLVGFFVMSLGLGVGGGGVSYSAHLWLALLVPYQIVLMWIMITLPEGEKWFPGVQGKIRFAIPVVWVLCILFLLSGLWVAFFDMGILLLVAASGVFSLIVSVISFSASFSGRGMFGV
ncbi:hypothetical protein VSQ78_06640 [Nocardiopsis alba]|uniref:Uncharacterized protein n=1 Tax=Nocardiopsis alba TaxID=53437 RepID=A0ABV5DS11_9ACTN|nr:MULTISPECIES: hypothetical protein [Nocardiopsis]MEC3894609.1 hypothetical protein [Nocardiopsis sp. LDBS1602]